MLVQSYFGLFLLFTYIFLACYQFYILRKFKNTIYQCIKYTLGAIFSVFFGFVFLAWGFDVFFDDFKSTSHLTQKFFSLPSFIILLIYYFFGIRNYQYTAGHKIHQNETTIFDWAILGGIVLVGGAFFRYVSLLFIGIGMMLWELPSSMLNIRFVDGPLTLIYYFINNITFYIFGDYTNQILSIGLILLGGGIILFISFLIWYFMWDRFLKEFWNKFTKKKIK